jgi:hypothetical protein
MSAITEIPAKTPRPMGRTDSVFPGRVNPVPEESAAAAVPLLESTVGEEVAVFAAATEADELDAGVSVGFVELEDTLAVEVGYDKVSRSVRGKKSSIHS